MVSSLFLQLLYNYCIDINIYLEDSTGNTKSNWDFIFCLGVVIPSAVKTVFYFPLQAALFLGVNQTWRMLEIYNNSLQSKAVQRLCYCYLRLHLVWKTPRPTTFQQEFRD